MKGQDLIDYLTSQGFNVFPDPNFIPGDVPDAMLPALFVMGTGGYAPHEYIPLSRPTFQIIIKGHPYRLNPTTMSATEQHAQSVIDHLHRRTNFMAGETYVFSCLATQSNPIHIGLDEQDRPTFSTNFQFRVRG